MELEIVNIKGEKTGRSLQLNDAVFAIKPNDHAIYLDVKQHLANKRQGTHKAKERAEVSRSTRKLFKQKHTGRARSGSFKSPVHKGGGTIFGPRPRDYGFKLNKKVKTVARKSALSYKAIGNEITVVEDFKMESPKTKEYAAFLNLMNTGNRRSLFVVGESTENISHSARNIPNARVLRAADLNTYEVMNAKKLILSESSVKIIENLLS